MKGDFPFYLFTFYEILAYLYRNKINRYKNPMKLEILFVFLQEKSQHGY